MTAHRDISKARAILVQAGFREWGDRELFYHCGQRVIFSRERIDHKDDNWVADKIAEGNPGPDGASIRITPSIPTEALRAVEERCRPRLAARTSAST